MGCSKTLLSQTFFGCVRVHTTGNHFSASGQRDIISEWQVSRRVNPDLRALSSRGQVSGTPPPPQWWSRQHGVHPGSAVPRGKCAPDPYNLWRTWQDRRKSRHAVLFPAVSLVQPCGRKWHSWCSRHNNKISVAGSGWLYQYYVIYWWYTKHNKFDSTKY